MTLNTNFYFNSPVEVVRVTPKNLAEVAEWCGGKVARTASRHIKNKVDSYVHVPTPKGAPISWAFPGMFITKRLAVSEKNDLKATYSVFRKDYFGKNFFKKVSEASAATWERELKEKEEAITVVSEAKIHSINLHLEPGADSESIIAEIKQLFTDNDIDGGLRVLNTFVSNKIEEGPDFVMIPIELPEQAIIDQDESIPEPMHEQRIALHEDQAEAAAE